ncbi:hypothetical protein AAG906_001935 [Vitis piasezkii]
MVRTQTDVDYVGDRVVVEPIDVPLGTTYEQLLEIKNDSGVAQMLEMHNRFGINEVELFVEQVSIDLQMNSPIGNCMPLLLSENDSTSNFENVENIGHVVSSEWTPWGNTLMGHPTGEFIIGQIFNSKGDLQHRLRATVVKGTSLFEINKYSGPHTCVNPCMNQDHHQLDSNLIAAHIEGMIKTQFTLSVAAIQASVVEIFGNRVTQRRGLCVISDRHPGIMAAFANVYLGWSEPNAYHRICMRHLASNFMTHFKDKCLKQLLCRAVLETKVEKFNMHMETIGRINQDALNWLEAIPFEKWALSHDGEVFNNVLKGARSFPITAFVQLTFYRVNSYFVVRREHGASRLASGEQYTPYVDAKINANVVKAGSHEVVLYDHFQGLFHVKASRGSKKTSSGGRTHRVNLREHGCTCGKTLIYGFPCSHILAACHFRSIDFRSFVQHYYTIQSYFSTWAPLFNPIHNEYEWPPYVGPVIVPADSMKRVSGGRPKSTRLHNEMDVREGKTSVTCGLCKQSGHNRCSCPNKNMGVGPS